MERQRNPGPARPADTVIPDCAIALRAPRYALRATEDRSTLQAPGGAKEGRVTFADDNHDDLGLPDRHHFRARRHIRGRGSARRAAERAARPRALPLHAVAARPLHAADPAGRAADPLGMRQPRKTAPLEAKQELLKPVAWIEPCETQHL